MTSLPDCQDPREVLASSGLRPRKSLGQCFLVDRSKLARIAEAAVPDASWTAVEIGAGTGALTHALAGRASRVVAIETDPALAAHLRRFFAGVSNVEVIEDDARNADFGRRTPGGGPLCVVGNLPYHLTGILLERILEADPPPDRVVVTVQLEVADRLVAPPGSRTCGALSVLTAASWRPTRIFRIERGSFYPPPKVSSATVLLEPLGNSLCTRDLHPAFRTLVISVFSHRRKTLRNALLHAGYPPESVGALEGTPGVTLGDRPERHGAAAFVEMAKRLPPSAALVRC